MLSTQSQNQFHVGQAQQHVCIRCREKYLLLLNRELKVSRYVVDVQNEKRASGPESTLGRHSKNVRKSVSKVVTAIQHTIIIL